jgi:adenylylsulfate reductase subunit A
MLNVRCFETDVLIVGGGTAGCGAALALGDYPGLRVTIAEKAHIERSGCLAAGVNALNAYIVPGRTPEDYLEYVRRDAAGIVREDLLLSAARRFNKTAEKLEALGLVILKNQDGSYATRGKRNVKINGENIKPLLADAVSRLENVTVLNRVNVVDYLSDGERVWGAVGFRTEEEELCVFRAPAVICATGGAAGLYRPNNPGFSRHKMWYCPFNTGAGYAMGLRAGAEMTTFEMRFVALRCKDTAAPTGTIAQGVKAGQVNAGGEAYEERYGFSTWERLQGVLEEERAGRGPSFLQTRGISPEEEEQLLKAYLNMAPSQVLKWFEDGGPRENNVEIEGTEPYIVGGHTAGGYWVDTRRRSTLAGLFAAGDVAGGCPQKYVTGALAEGEIAAQSALEWLHHEGSAGSPPDFEPFVQTLLTTGTRWLSRKNFSFTAEDLEEAMQTTMDVWAGGISSGYRYSGFQLARAKSRIEELETLTDELGAEDMEGVLRVCELRERLLVCRAVIAHLDARRETRWRSFACHLDHPDRDDEHFLKYVNSRLTDGKVTILYRNLVKGETYEHSDR